MKQEARSSDIQNNAYTGSQLQCTKSSAIADKPRGAGL